MRTHVPSSEACGLLFGNGDLDPAGTGLRTASWEEIARILGLLRRGPPRSTHGLWVMSGGNRFVHRVPAPLRHIGCMWLDQGMEDRRCGRPPAWTMGRELCMARLYCEAHGWMILARREELLEKRSRTPREHRKDQRCTSTDRPPRQTSSAITRA